VPIFACKFRVRDIRYATALAAIAFALVLHPAAAVQGQEKPLNVQASSTVCPASQPAIPVDGVQNSPGSPAPIAGSICITLDDAIARARKNTPQFHSAVTNSGIAHEDKKQSLAGLLPSITYDNQFIYTQPGAENGNVRFIANNAPREYISQGHAHESIGVAEIADYRRVSAAASIAKAQLEIAARGLTYTVVQLYYALASAEAKEKAASETSRQGEDFLTLTKNLEAGGEVAHSDTIKAALQAEDRKRQWQEARLTSTNARLDLAVVLFPAFSTAFELANDLHADVPLPTLGEVQQQAAKDNPDIRAALDTVRESGHDVASARAGYLPTLGLDFFYGIDAPNFATHYAGVSNLGYAGAVSLNIPVWNWGATQSRVKQAELRREQSKLELSYAQRKLLAEIQSLYTEAQTAKDEQAGLDRALHLASDSLRLTTLRYKNGESTVLDVVDAQTAFANASSAYEDGAARYLVALANLQTLTGTLTIR
jgi:outer membrane protein TolC